MESRLVQYSKRQVSFGPNLEDAPKKHSKFGAWYQFDISDWRLGAKVTPYWDNGKHETRVAMVDLGPLRISMRITRKSGQ